MRRIAAALAGAVWFGSAYIGHAVRPAAVLITQRHSRAVSISPCQR